MRSEWTCLLPCALFRVVLSLLSAGPTANALEDLAAAYGAFETFRGVL